MAVGRDIALIFLILHALIGCIVPLALLFLVARGLVVTNRKAQQTMPTIQNYARRFADGTERVSQRVVDPLIGVHAAQARWRAMFGRVTAPVRNARSSSRDVPPQPNA